MKKMLLLVLAVIGLFVSGAAYAKPNAYSVRDEYKHEHKDKDHDDDRDNKDHDGPKSGPSTPEPISCTLFALGGGALIAKKLRKQK